MPLFCDLVNLVVEFSVSLSRLCDCQLCLQFVSSYTDDTAKLTALGHCIGPLHCIALAHGASAQYRICVLFVVHMQHYDGS